MAHTKPRIAVHKFTSCDGCQLAFLNLGEDLFELTEAVDIIHFPELGPVDPDAPVDVAFIEGSVSTSEHLEQVKTIRDNSQFLITIGACATAGGIQALRNLTDKVDEWVADVYAKPAVIDTLSTSTPIAEHVKVDLELWGCPVNSEQIIAAIRVLLQDATPHVDQESVCMECKREGNICVMVVSDTPCMGPVTQTGCGALCPAAERGCYACYGPKETANPASLIEKFKRLQLSEAQIKRRFLFITSHTKTFQQAASLVDETS